ncbi:MAG: ABC transporter ATP-binding protein [Chitinophagaceae bacterium]|nr:MAG: ABC transporter ATP-binding protein [Chitinophagaceae bacterium]
MKALDNVSFNVPQGSVFGILGPNGSGKTTLLGIVMDILKASSGTYLWNGQPCSETIRQRIGTLLETPNFYQYLSGERNLVIAAEIKQRGKEDIARVLDIVNLQQRKDSKFSTYSLGMKQRLAIASTLLGNPDILVFDEPTNGLDPAGIAEIRTLIKDLNRQGKTIIMASHILDEVEKVCTHVAIIQKGDLKAVGSVRDILDSKSSSQVFIEVGADDLGALQQVLQQMPGVVSTEYIENHLQAICGDEVTATQVNRFCFEKGIVLNRLNMKRKSLESTFLEITGTKSER